MGHAAVQPLRNGVLGNVPAPHQYRAGGRLQHTDQRFRQLGLPVALHAGHTQYFSCVQLE